LDIRCVRFLHPTHGRSIVFVDTPGFDGAEKSEIEILEVITEGLKTMYNREILLAGVVYLHRISDARMAGTPWKNLQLFTNLCGNYAIRNVVFATTMWDTVKPEVGSRREDELRTKYWKEMMENGCKIARFDKTFKSAWEIIDLIVGNEAYALLIQEEMALSRRELSETTAGKILYTKLQKLLADRQRIYDEASKQTNPQQAVRLGAQLKANQENLRQTLSQIQEIKVLGRRILALFGFPMRRATV